MIRRWQHVRIAPRTTERADPMYATQTATQPRPNRITPRWFSLPVVREVPLPQTQPGSSW